MKKSFKSLFLYFCLLLGALLFVNTPTEAEAASYARTDRNTKVGKYYIWEDYTTKTLQISTSKTGDGTTLVHASSGRNICSGILSNGSTVYYLEGKYAGSSHTGYIYRIKTNGTGRTYIGKVNRASALTAYYDGNLYLDCDDKNDYMLIHTYRFNLKSKKATRVIKNLSVHNFYSKYFVGSPNRGDYGPNDLYSYNCKTKKKTKITSKSGGSSKVGSKLYYAEFLDKGYSSVHTFRIRRCNFSGSSKKTVAKIKASGISRITSTYVYYLTYTRSGYRYYRYNMKAKKAENISESQYFGR